MLKIDTENVVGQIDEKIYGHCLEHIHHSCNGGLWGEVVWNRSFEEARSNEPWRIVNGFLEPVWAEHDPAKGPRESLMTIGDGAWRDYEFQVELLKTGGEGTLAVGVRCEHDTCLLRFGTASHPQHELQVTNENRTLKKRETDVLWHGDGQVELNRWYAVRIRCTGPRVQAWLDGQPLVDVEVKHGPINGPAAIGVYEAEGQFRNIRVVAIDGKTMIDGPPPSPSRHWRAVGPVTVEISGDHPLNDKHCLKIAAHTAGAGIQQNAQAVRAGDALRGSLWLHGSAPDGMVVRLTKGDQIMAEATLPASSDHWQEFPIVLAPTTTDDNLSLQILSRGSINVCIDQVSLMPDSFRATGGFRPDLLKAATDVHPALIRWPGGSFVNGYNWKNGLGKQHERIGKKGWDEYDPASLGIDEFITLCRKTGAAPLIAINVGHNDLQLVRDASDFIEYCNGPPDSPWGNRRADGGHPQPYNVKYWEIGNGTWGMGAETYSQVVRQFVPPMRMTDPSISIVVCGSGGLESDGIGQAWNQAIIEQCAGRMDYLSIHHYENPNNFAAGPAKFESFIHDAARLIAASKNPKIKLFVSEWNAQSIDWRTGLYCGGLLNAFERSSDTVGMASPALFLRHVSAADWDNAFINFNHRAWFPAPNYVVMQLYRNNFAPHLLKVEGDVLGLNIVATKSADGSKVYIKAVNTTDAMQDVHVELSGRTEFNKAELKLVAADDLTARNTLDEPAAIHASSGKSSSEGKTVRFSLPRWSVGVVTLVAIIADNCRDT
jgi:alpha-N-arabinofuranosidase